MDGSAGTENTTSVSFLCFRKTNDARHLVVSNPATSIGTSIELSQVVYEVDQLWN